MYLEGAGAAGKSWFIRGLGVAARAQLERIELIDSGDAKAVTMPVLLKFIELAEQQSEDDPIAAALAAKLGQDATLAPVALDAHVLLLIDGLDEVANAEQRDALLKMIVKDHGSRQLIIFATTRYSRMNGEQLPPLGFQALHLQPPSPKVAESLMGSACDLVGADPLRLRMLRVVAAEFGKDKTASLSRAL